jgi:DUF1009 family protein
MTRKIGLIAGNGQFPLLFARAAQKKSWQVYAVGYRDETDPQLFDHVTQMEWLYLGQVKKLINYFHKNEVREAVMLGAITKTRMFTNVRPDIKAISLIASMRHTHDDAILRAFAELLEKEGIRVLASTLLLPELLAPAGIWTKRKPSSEQWQDIRLGWQIAKKIGQLDIGQCVIVGGGSVLAVEAIEGTDAAILRGGTLSKGQAVIVKVCKPDQDIRFDIPAIGKETIETMHKAGIKVLVIEAGKAVVFDQAPLIQMADRNGMVIAALKKSDIGSLSSSEQEKDRKGSSL